MQRWANIQLLKKKSQVHEERQWLPENEMTPVEGQAWAFSLTVIKFKLYQ